MSACAVLRIGPTTKHVVFLRAAVCSRETAQSPPHGLFRWTAKALCRAGTGETGAGQGQHASILPM